MYKRQEVSGVKISKTDQDKILTAMFTPSEVVEYTNDAGKKEKTRVTKLQVLQAELQNDPAKQVAYALWLLNGSDSVSYTHLDVYKRQVQR